MPRKPSSPSKCQFVEDNKGLSDRMVGFYYCVTHHCRTSSMRPCWKSKRR